MAHNAFAESMADLISDGYVHTRWPPRSEACSEMGALRSIDRHGFETAGGVTEKWPMQDDAITFHRAPYSKACRWENDLHLKRWPEENNRKNATFGTADTGRGGSDLHV